MLAHRRCTNHCPRLKGLRRRQAAQAADAGTATAEERFSAAAVVRALSRPTENITGGVSGTGIPRTSMYVGRAVQLTKRIACD